MVRDYWYEFVYWLEDNWQIVVGVTILVIFFGGLIYLKSDPFESNPLTPEVKASTLEEVEAMKKVTEKLDDVFSVLEERSIGSHKEYPAYEVYLYLKEPFIHEKDLEEELKKYIEIMKWKENYKLSGLKINLYDRKLVYEKGLMPRATIYYSWKMDEDDLLDEDDGGERVKGIDVVRTKFQETIDVGEEPVYDDYTLRIDGFQQLVPNREIVPLTDQEFEFYLKLDLYRTIMGGNRYSSAELYLQWDLGKDVHEDGVVAIEREFLEFEKRHTGIGAQDTYYDNILLTQQELAKTEPQFLLFALTKKVEDSPLDAQYELIQHDPDLFGDILEDYIKEKSEEVGEEMEKEEKENEEFNIEQKDVEEKDSEEKESD